MCLCPSFMLVSMSLKINLCKEEPRGWWILTDAHDDGTPILPLTALFNKSAITEWINEFDGQDLLQNHTSDLSWTFIKCIMLNCYRTMGQWEKHKRAVNQLRRIKEHYLLRREREKRRIEMKTRGSWMAGEEEEWMEVVLASKCMCGERVCACVCVCGCLPQPANEAPQYSGEAAAKGPFS